jgi:prepilin-type N-terminal cleavage/methylation domain-containing protein
MRRKGFTLVELLVVIAIIALLMSILMPALAQVRRLAQRIICATHLSAIGKAMLVYAEDNEQDFPRSGGRLSTLSNTGKINNWHALTGNPSPQAGAFGGTADQIASVTSCFFLLIKYSDGIPKIFNCAGDLNARVFDLSDWTGAGGGTTALTDIRDAWDFGNGQEGTLWPGQYVSYSYHMPFNWIDGGNSVCFALRSSESAASPVCSERNPYLDINAKSYLDAHGTQEKPVKWDNSIGVIDVDKVRNAATHQREGQNVLYVDAHVEFESSPSCGVQNDLIWVPWEPTTNYTQMTAQKRQFRQPDCTGIVNPNKFSQIGPRHIEDAFLIGEANVARGGWW